MTRTVKTCSSCGKRRQLYARGWCTNCYHRWHANGKPASGPPPLQQIRDKKRHLAHCRDLLANGVTGTGELTRHLGVSRRTVQRYLAELLPDRL